MTKHPMPPLPTDPLSETELHTLEAALPGLITRITVGQVRRLIATVRALQQQIAAARLVRNRLVAIRDEAVKQPPARDFNIGWQLGRALDDLEVAIGVRSSQLDALIQEEPHAD